jgi:hypothetical protein
MMNTFGTLLNDDLQSLPSIISIVEGQAEFGANSELSVPEEHANQHFHGRGHSLLQCRDW